MTLVCLLICSDSKLCVGGGAGEYTDRLSPSSAPSSGPALHYLQDSHKEGLQAQDQRGYSTGGQGEPGVVVESSIQGALSPKEC